VRPASDCHNAMQPSHLAPQPHPAIERSHSMLPGETSIGSHLALILSDRGRGRRHSDCISHAQMITRADALAVSAVERGDGQGTDILVGLPTNNASERTGRSENPARGLTPRLSPILSREVTLR
jgi:hypothetical protein